MQRVFQFSTPAWMDERNLQHEFNFHNMATNPAENAFYLGTFFSLVYFPFVFAASPFLQKYAMLHALLPGTSTMAIGVLTTTFSIEMWNIFGVQLAFFFALTAIAMTAFSLWRNGERISALTAFSATVALVAFQAMDFVSGPNFVRYWDDTELKELVVALGLLLLAAEIFLRASGASGVKPPASDARTGNAEE